MNDELHAVPRTSVLAWLLVALGVGIAVASLLGPLGAGTIAYRTSETTLDQIVGGDLAGLVVVAPTALVAAWLVARRHRAGPVIALAPALWAVYIYLQLIVGQEHLRVPGNGERFFPLLLTLFVLGQAIAVLAWRRIGPDLPSPTARLERTAGVVLLVIAAFLVLGLHVPSLLDAFSAEPSAVAYTSSPTAFWIVKVMDLGIIVPAAIAIGVGLVRHRPWARTPAYALLGSYTLLSAAVTGMAAVMYVNDDPDGSLVNLLAFATFTVLLAVLTARLLAPLFRTDPDVPLVREERDTHLEVGAR